MDGGSLILILVLAVLILMSAYFSASETAFTSMNKVRMKNLANNGNKKAALALKVSGNYDRLLSTILIGNNIVNITSASLATIIFTRYFGDIGVTLSTVVMTVLVLIFSEISPKSLATESPETFAMFSAPILNFLIIILTPLNFLFVQWKKLLSKIFKFKSKRGITEEELLTIVDEAHNDGGINEEESDLIKSAIEFNDLEVKDIYTPRVDIIAVEKSESKANVAKIFADSGFSRLPVYIDSIDNIVGVINQKDFYNYAFNTDRTIESIIKPIVFIVQSMKISELLTMLQQTKSHIAVIIDEFGGTVGIVTMEDILEELVGDIWDEHDEIIQEFTKISDNEYKVLCSADLDDMFEMLGINNKCDISTVSGWVIQQFGRIPDVGDNFEYDNLLVTVTKTDYKRVLEIKITVNDKKE